VSSDDETLKFGAALDLWLADVKAEALQLFRGGVPPDKCGDIAIGIVNAKAVGKMRRMQSVAGAGVVGVRGRLS